MPFSRASRAVASLLPPEVPAFLIPWLERLPSIYRFLSLLICFPVSWEIKNPRPCLSLCKYILDTFLVLPTLLPSQVTLCFSPVGTKLRVRSRKFPAIVNCTAIDWFHEWPQQALESVSFRFLQNTEDIEVRGQRRHPSSSSPPLGTRNPTSGNSRLLEHSFPCGEATSWVGRHLPSSWPDDLFISCPLILAHSQAID